MTARVDRMNKPHIRLMLVYWVCRCPHYSGVGSSPRAAYLAWAKKANAYDARWHVVARNVLRHFWRNVLMFR